MSQLSISVIIPVYNVAPYIERCIRSVLNQTLSANKYEVIAIDDCGSDDSITILQSVSKLYPRHSVRVIRQPHNMGQGQGRTAGLKSAKGDYVLFIDSDDWIESDMLQIMYNKAVSENAEVVCCEVCVHWPNEKWHWVFDYDTEIRSITLKNDYWGNAGGAWWNKLFKRTLLLKFGLFLDTRISVWEDSIFVIPAKLLANKVVICHNELYNYNCTREANTMKKGIDFLVAEEQKALLLFINIVERLGLKTECENLIEQLKLNIRTPLLRKPTKEHVKLFRYLYPETNRLLLRQSGISLIVRTRNYIASVLPLRLATLVIRFIHKK